MAPIIDADMNHAQRADRTVLRLKLIFVAIFALSGVAIWAYHLLVVMPRDRCASQQGVWMARTRQCAFPPSARCEAKGGWWDPQSKTCAKVFDVPSFTGRPSKIIQ
jgi:hypothetical protein